MNEVNIYDSYELHGGLVNNTRVVVEDGARYVHQQSEIIHDDFFDAVYDDRKRTEDMNIRQIQVDPAKFLRAKAVSEVLLEREMDHASILEARDHRSYGSAVLKYIEGLPGSSVLAMHRDVVWSGVGTMLANIHQVPYHSLAQQLGHDLASMERPDWLERRFGFLLTRLNASMPGVPINMPRALDSYHYLFDLLPEVDQPVCLTYDDAKPDALMFSDITETPHIVDMESFTIGHRIIDGIGRALYWGPIREPVKQGCQPDYEARHLVAETYNNSVPASWNISPELTDLWCIASELFWLPDVAATHTIAPFLPAARLQGTQGKVQRLANLLDALQRKDLDEARDVVFS